MLGPFHRLQGSKKVDSSASLSDAWLVIAKSVPRLLEYEEHLFLLCKDLGIVINWEKKSLRANQQGSTSQNADRHHSREGLPNGLLNCQGMGCGGQIPSFIISRGKGEDASPLVATEVKLVTGDRWSCDTSPVITFVCQMLAAGRMVGIRSPSPGASYLFFCSLMCQGLAGVSFFRI